MDDAYEEWLASQPRLRPARKYQGTKRERQAQSAETSVTARRRFYRDLKRAPCTDCGVSYPPHVMDFDHRPGVDKVGNLSQLAMGKREVLLAELEKCELVCANCHRLRTHRRHMARMYGTQSDYRLAA